MKYTIKQVENIRSGCISRYGRISCAWQVQRHSSTLHKNDSTPAATSSLSSRWLSDVKARLGKCIIFGLNLEQKVEVGEILAILAKDWRDLVAGSEGYLTSAERRGLYRYPTAWGEQDSMQHINNIVYNRWAESGRIAWTRSLARIDSSHATYWRQLMTPKDEGLILRKITTEYKLPIKFPDHVSVYHKLSSVPDETDSIMLDCVILSELHQRVAARTYEDIALYNYNIGKKVNKQPWMLELLNETWQLQLQAKEINSARVHSLLDRVRKLEKQSWDRADAVEDNGSS